jgi:hypothetical protein
MSTLNLSRLTSAPSSMQEVALEIPPIPELEVSDRFREHYREQAQFFDDYNEAMRRWADALGAAFEGSELKPGLTKEI